MSERVTVTVSWDADLLWHYTTSTGKQVGLWSFKNHAVAMAAEYCREMLAEEGVYSDLIIKNKSGKIGKGGSSRRTYGGDPEDSKG